MNSLNTDHDKKYHIQLICGTGIMNTWGMGAVGETTADVITMIINSAISFWVFFPIFKIIFKQEK